MKSRFSLSRATLSALGGSLLLTAAVLGFTCAVFGLYPFGDDSLCWCDMRQQGLPLLMMLRNALLSGDSLWHLPGLTGGSDFLGVSAFFLMNPGSLLSVFWKAENLLNLLNLLVFGKLLLCAATAAWFFSRRFPQNGVGFAVAFSCAYALCGYGLLYYQNLMWLDVMALFPLFLLSCYALLERGRPLGYLVLMALTMAVCFYIGFMVALFTLLFFGVHLCLCREHRVRTATQFLFSSFAAALLSAPVWLPTFWQVLHSARGTALSASLTSCSWATPLYTAFPLLLCSAGLPFLLLVTALFFPQWKRKTAALALLCGLLLLPMILDPINRMWHMGSYMCFPCRFAFIPIFLLLTLVAHLWADTPVLLRPQKELRLTLTVLCAALIATAAYILTLLFDRYGEEAARYVRTLWGDEASLKVHLLAFAVVVSVATLIALSYRSGLLKKSVCAALLCALFCCESAFYCAVYIGTVPRYWRFDTFSAVTDLADRTDGDTFARVKTSSDILDSNMVGALGYSSFGGYTSLVTEDTLYTAKKLGYTANWMDIGTNGGTLFSDYLLSVGYTIQRSYAADTENSVVYDNGLYRLEQLSYFLPLGLLSDRSALVSLADLSGDSRIAVQEDLAAALFDETALISRYTPSSVTQCSFSQGDSGATFSVTGASPCLNYTIFVSDRQTLYLDCFDGYSTRVKEPIFNSFSVSVNGTTLCTNYPNSSESGFLTLGTFENETVTVTLIPLKSETVSSFGLFGLHHSAMQRITAAARTAGLTYDGRSYGGTVTAEEGDSLLVTVPYSDGFTAYVDGKRVPLEKALGNYLSLPLESGTHTIRITYTPPFLTVGLLLCGAGLALTVLAVLFRRRIDNRLAAHPNFMKIGGRIATFAALLAGAACFITVYLFPVVYKLLNS